MALKRKPFASLKAAEDFAAIVDKAAGLPRDGVNVGGGRHVPVELGRTTKWSEVIVDNAEPVNKWKYDLDDSFNGSAVVVKGAPVVIDLADAVDVIVDGKPKEGDPKPTLQEEAVKP